MSTRHDSNRSSARSARRTPRDKAHSNPIRRTASPAARSLARQSDMIALHAAPYSLTARSDGQQPMDADESSRTSVTAMDICGPVSLWVRNASTPSRNDPIPSRPAHAARAAHLASPANPSIPAIQSCSSVPDDHPPDRRPIPAGIGPKDLPAPDCHPAREPKKKQQPGMHAKKGIPATGLPSRRGREPSRHALPNPKKRKNPMSDYPTSTDPTSGRYHEPETIDADAILDGDTDDGAAPEPIRIRSTDGEGRPTRSSPTPTACPFGSRTPAARSRARTRPDCSTASGSGSSRPPKASTNWGCSSNRHTTGRHGSPSDTPQAWRDGNNAAPTSSAPAP